MFVATDKEIDEYKYIYECIDKFIAKRHDTSIVSKYIKDLGAKQQITTDITKFRMSFVDDYLYVSFFEKDMLNAFKKTNAKVLNLTNNVKKLCFITNTIITAKSLLSVEKVLFPNETIVVCENVILDIILINLLNTTMYQNIKITKLDEYNIPLTKFILEDDPLSCYLNLLDGDIIRIDFICPLTTLIGTEVRFVVKSTEKRKNRILLEKQKILKIEDVEDDVDVEDNDDEEYEYDDEDGPIAESSDEEIYDDIDEDDEDEESDDAVEYLEEFE